MKKLFIASIAILLTAGACQNEKKGKDSANSLANLAPPPPPTPGSIVPPPPPVESAKSDSLVPPVEPPPPPRQDKTDEKTYDFVSMKTPPNYPGGIQKFYEFLGRNIKYPPAAAANNVQGNVFVSFVVEKDGSVANIKVDKKLGSGTDEEAVRVLRLSKKWNPGLDNGKPVRAKYYIPIKFNLAN